jgi:hypothetical protein
MASNVFLSTGASMTQIVFVSSKAILLGAMAKRSSCRRDERQ